MIAHVNENCIGCGLCVNLCPGVFAMNEQGVAQAVGEVPEAQTAQAGEARDGCPVDAIELE